ncbi:MAG: sugar phosphate nucleotidyltransferase, partial [Vicinamibacterales bacterium]
MIPAIVLAAGFGTRLRPLSDVLAKPAMPVAGAPLVERILRQVSRAGVTDAVLNLHHLGHTVTAAVGDGSHLGLRVRYSWEREILGSGGGPARALRLIDGDRALVLNGDTLTDFDLAALVRTHDQSGALVTLAVVPNTAPRKYGGVSATADGVFTGLVPRGASASSWHFVGVHVVARAAYDGVSPDAPADSISGVYRALAEARPGSVRVAPVDTTFDDIGTPDDYLRTCLRLAGGNTALLRGRGVTVAPDAVVEASVLWDDVTVEAGARVERCVLTAGTRVPAGSDWR